MITCDSVLSLRSGEVGEEEGGISLGTACESANQDGEHRRLQ
jgi:hypothetical protein